MRSVNVFRVYELLPLVMTRCCASSSSSSLFSSSLRKTGIGRELSITTTVTNNNNNNDYTMMERDFGKRMMMDVVPLYSDSHSILHGNALENNNKNYNNNNNKYNSVFTSSSTHPFHVSSSSSRTSCFWDSQSRLFAASSASGKKYKLKTPSRVKKGRIKTCTIRGGGGGGRGSYLSLGSPSSHPLSAPKPSSPLSSSSSSSRSVSYRFFGHGRSHLNSKMSSSRKNRLDQLRTMTKGYAIVLKKLGVKKKKKWRVKWNIRSLILIHSQICNCLLWDHCVLCVDFQKV